MYYLKIRVLFVELLKSDPGSTEASAGVDNGAWPNKTHRYKSNESEFSIQMNP